MNIIDHHHLAGMTCPPIGCGNVAGQSGNHYHYGASGEYRCRLVGCKG